MENDVACVDPPDQVRTGCAFRPPALRAVEVNANIATVGDFQPETLAKRGSAYH